MPSRHWPVDEIDNTLGNSHLQGNKGLLPRHFPPRRLLMARANSLESGLFGIGHSACPLHQPGLILKQPRCAVLATMAGWIPTALFATAIADSAHQKPGPAANRPGVRPDRPGQEWKLT